RSTPRAEDTRRRIYDAALELFREKGFEQTTMRDIAARAGVALGGAYYYFSSKEAIVLAFYQDTQESSHDSVLQEMAAYKELRERIRCLITTRLQLLAPNRKFCAALFRHAPDPADPLSPFSDETRPIRERAIEHFQIAMDGGNMKFPSDLKPHLPFLLWLYQMGLILFWLYDRSPNQERTAKLLDKTLTLLVNLLRISSAPLMKPLRTMLLEIVDIVIP
ncbi:MAG: TetR/AcrR family transcriptional regulator, partial [Actinomycetota bacterium]